MACFVKAFGITFLALPRSDAADRAHEAPPTMRVAMAALAASCVALGVGPTLVVPALGSIAASVLGVTPPATVGVTPSTEAAMEPRAGTTSVEIGRAHV